MYFCHLWTYRAESKAFYDSVFSLLLIRRRMCRLGPSKIIQVDFLPKEVVSYTKETQTPIAPNPKDGKNNHMLNTDVYRI